MSTRLRGIAASPGIAIAPVHVVSPRSAAPRAAVARCAEEPSSPEREWTRYLEAVEASRLELAALRDKTRAELGDLKAEIFDAHLSILKDPELESTVSRNVREEKMSAVRAIEEAARLFIALLSEVEGDLFAARIDDIRDLASRIASHLDCSGGATRIEMRGEAVIVSESLTPSETTQLDRRFVKAFVTSSGSASSHSSILARSMLIPAVVGLGPLEGIFAQGSTVIVDGGEGIVIVNPEPFELATYGKARDEAAEAARAAQRFASMATVTKDGHALELAANIGGPADVEGALAAGAEGVGLFRTEFLYMDRPTLPSEDEQCLAYTQVLERMAPRPVVIRTLDIGGDKGVDCLDLESEPNPFLGVRAIRLCFAREDIFRTQLRALLRASVRGNLRIMFPMIATLEELREAKRMLAEERRGLEEAGCPVGRGIEVGMMIEIPAAAMMADQLAKEADFFSVGTNDLVQYSMAADRMSPTLARLNQPLHPAILRTLGSVAEAARGRGRWTGICGEMAADPLALPLLVGMGFDELSMSAASIPRSREIVSKIDRKEARALYERARDLETADEVRALVRAGTAKQ